MNLELHVDVQNVMVEICEKLISKPQGKMALQLVHGLLRCKNVSCSCLWNREEKRT